MQAKTFEVFPKDQLGRGQELPSGSMVKYLKTMFPNQKPAFMGRTKQAQLPEVRKSSVFFQALHTSYARHFDFGVRPEVLLYLVLSTVAETVKRNSTDYRHLFTSSDDRETVTVRHDGLRLGDLMSPWDEAIPLFKTALQKIVPSNIMDEVLLDLSTSTPESDVANLVAFMDMASPFYNYRVLTMCGIPKIHVFGTPEDYKKLIATTLYLSVQFKEHLEDYFLGVLQVLFKIQSELTRSDGQDTSFWGSIYKFHRGSGGDSFSGWAAAFLGYVNQLGGGKCLVSVPRTGLADWNKAPSVYTGTEPTHISKVPFIWEYLGRELPMDFVAGVMAVDKEKGALVPSLSYAVLHELEK